MKVLIVTPASPESHTGNAVTASRWARILRGLHHEVIVANHYDDAQAADLLISLHARRGHDAVMGFREHNRERPIIVALTGTDLYGDVPTSPEAQRSLEIATRLITLQAKGLDALPRSLHSKTRVVYQSAARPASHPLPKPGDAFRVCLLAHLREVKDPLRSAYAARRLPASSRVRVVHAGRALDPRLGRDARTEASTNPRYVWLGSLSHEAARRLLGGSHLMALTSRMEGGANVVAEAIVAGVPVAASRIPGTIGMLDEDYPGYFEVGDTEGLAELFHRAETDDHYYARLVEWVEEVAPRFSAQEEIRAWRELLAELAA